MVDFVKIAITLPGDVVDEPARIMNLLDNGFWRVHIRKPDWSLDEVEQLIKKIGCKYRSRLVLHDKHALAVTYSLAGVHLNRRNPVNHTGLPASVSCHSVEELDLYPHACYRFLSPIYDSISKVGYKSAFNLSDIRTYVAGKNVVALGGVVPDRFEELRAAGFIGAAMMGAAFG